MNITIENKKQKAIELMQKLDIYKPYIKGFKEKTDVCFFECFGGYWAYQEPELMAKIKEFEEQYNVLVYAVTHEYTDFGECYDFLYISDYEEEWDEILDNVKGAVDIMAFQDGQVDYHELYDYLVINKKLADKYNMKCWTNIESFDRDMPIRFLPIKWEKLLLKLDAARRAGMENAITFEFSHFMSPNSAYLQAGHLYERYCEHFIL